MPTACDGEQFSTGRSEAMLGAMAESSKEWALGRAEEARTYAQTGDGVLVVDGVAVTDPKGWIRFSLRPQSYPWQIRLRIRLDQDGHGRPVLFAGEAMVGSRRYGSLHELVSAESGDWLALLGDAVRTEIARRVGHASRASRAGAAGGLEAERVRTGVRATVRKPRSKSGTGRG